MGAKPAEAKRLLEQVRRGLANPLQAGLAGAVVEGQNQQDAPVVGGRGGIVRGRLAGSAVSGENTENQCQSGARRATARDRQTK